MNIINCKKLLYSLLVILLIMSIICYYVNMESFAGRIRRRHRRKRKNKISNASINAAIKAQDVTLPVTAIQFEKKSSDSNSTFKIESFLVTTDKEIIDYDKQIGLNSLDTQISLDTLNKYTFSTPQKIKEVSFTNTSITHNTQTSINDVLKDVMMKFLDSSGKTINQIEMPIQVETKFTFILPPYSQKYTIAQLYSQKIKNASAIAEALINADKLTIAKTNARIINDSIANALKNVSDISLNIDSINKQKTANTTKIDELQNSLKVSAVRFSKNYSDIAFNNEYKEAENSLNLVTPSTPGYVSSTTGASSIATFAIQNLKIATKKLPTVDTGEVTIHNIIYLDLVGPPANFSVSGVLSAPSDPNNINTIKITFKNPRIITNISFVNGSLAPYLARLTGVKMQLLNALDSVLHETILSSSNAPYNLNFPESYTPGSALAITQSEIDKIDAYNNNLDTKLNTKLEEQGKAIYKLEKAQSEDIQMKSSTQVYIQGYTALLSALKQVKTANTSLNNALSYNIYINEIVSTNYIILVEEQQIKMLKQALLYAKKAKSAIYNLLDQTKLTPDLKKDTTTTSTLTTNTYTEPGKLYPTDALYTNLTTNDTAYTTLKNNTIDTPQEKVKNKFRLYMLIDIQYLAKNELDNLSSSIISADSLLKSLLNPPSE